MTHPGRIWVPAELPFDYRLRPTPGEATELLVLLHGYQQTGSQLLEKVAPVCPASALTLSPNGPFMVPFRKADEYRAAYSWYFYDFKSGEYVVDMRVAVQYLVRGIEALGLMEVPKRIVGFSQGGYLAPIVAQSLAPVKQVVGIACEYLVDEIPGGKPSFRVDGIHGADDDIVRVAEARESHARLAHAGVAGELRVLPGVGHRIDHSVQAALAELLRR